MPLTEIDGIYAAVRTVNLLLRLGSSIQPQKTVPIAVKTMISNFGLGRIKLARFAL